MADKKTFWNTPSATGGALVGGLADGIGSLFTIGAQKRAATTAYKRQKEFWNMQNAYNTPKAQMERLKAAGLNPALMYGQGNVGNAMGLSSVGKADVSGPNLAQSAASGAQISLVNAQRKLMQEQAAAAKKDAATRMFEAFTNRKSYKLKEIFLPHQIDQVKAGIAKTFQDIDESQQRISVMEIDKVLKGSQIDLTIAQKNQAIEMSKKIMSDTDLVNTIIEMDYSDKTGRNIWTNLERVTDGMSTSTGGALGLLATVGALRNPAKAAQFGSKVASRAKTIYNKLKSAIKYKFGIKGWLNVK
jgi:phosphoribosylformylglycinamidine (FGAM) synthase PurS component